MNSGLSGSLNGKNKFWINNKSLIVGGILVFFSVFFFAAIYINRYATDVMGWQTYAATLLQDGKIPYKDFFYYVPIAYLFRLKWIWYFTGQNILVSRLVGVIERALMITIFYVIMTKWVKPYLSYLLSIISFLFLLKASYDGFGDYTQVSEILAIMSLGCFLLFFRYSEGNKRTIRNNILRGLLLLFAFLFGTLVILNKQSYGMVLILAEWLFIIVYVAIRHKKDTLFILPCSFAGSIIAILPWLLWLIVNGAVKPFVSQVFVSATNSKGFDNASGISDSMFVKLLNAIFTFEHTAVGIIVLTLLFLAYFSKKEIKIIKQIKRWLIVAVIVMVTAILYKDLLGIEITIANFFTCIPFVVGVVLICILILFFLKKSKNAVNGIIVFSSVLFILFAAVSFFTKNQLQIICEANTLSDFMEDIAHLGVIISIAIAIYCFVVEIVEKGQNNEIWCKFIAVVIGLAICFATQIGIGTFRYKSGGISFILVPLIICFAYSIQPSETPFGRKRNIFVVVLMFFSAAILTIGISEKLECPYTWWGYSVDTITDDDYYIFDYGLLSGLRVDKKTKTTITQVSRLIEENTDEDDFVFIFPYSVLYRMTTGRNNTPTAAPFYFFDVCPDDVAINDLEIIKNNPPKIIVWKELDESCWELHEELFRNGERLGQRDIQDWYNNVIESDYTLIGQVYNEYVYKLNDGTNIEYSFFAEENDLISNHDEVSNIIFKTNWVEKIAKKINIPFINILIYLVLLILLFVNFLSDKLWRVISIMIAGVYLTQLSNPVILLGFIPCAIAAFTYKRNMNSNKLHLNLYAGILSLISSGTFFLSWTRFWQHEYGGYKLPFFLCCILLAIITLDIILDLIRRRVKA